MAKKKDFKVDVPTSFRSDPSSTLEPINAKPVLKTASIYIEDELRTKLKMEALKQGKPFALFVRDILKNYIDNINQ